MHPTTPAHSSRRRRSNDDVLDSGDDDGDDDFDSGQPSRKIARTSLTTTTSNRPTTTAAAAPPQEHTQRATAVRIVGAVDTSFEAQIVAHRKLVQQCLAKKQAAASRRAKRCTLERRIHTGVTALQRLVREHQSYAPSFAFLWFLGDHDQRMRMLAAIMTLRAQTELAGELVELVVVVAFAADVGAIVNHDSVDRSTIRLAGLHIRSLPMDFFHSWWAWRSGSIDLSNNLLREIPPAAFRIFKITTTFTFSNNHCPSVLQDAQQFGPQLKRIVACGCGITALPQQWAAEQPAPVLMDAKSRAKRPRHTTAWPAAKPAKQHEGITHLCLDHNAGLLLTPDARFPRNLTQLSLCGCGIAGVPSLHLSHLAKLQVLDLSENPIEVLSDHAVHCLPPDMIRLEMRRTLLTDLPMAALMLRADTSPLADVNFHGCPLRGAFRRIFDLYGKTPAKTSTACMPIKMLDRCVRGIY